MTANLNLMTKHLSPILPLTHTASRVSAVWFEPLMKACDFLFDGEYMKIHIFELRKK